MAIMSILTLDSTPLPGTKKTIAHHTPEFDIHEGALWCGAAMWVALAMGNGGE